MNLTQTQSVANVSATQVSGGGAGPGANDRITEDAADSRITDDGDTRIID